MTRRIDIIPLELLASFAYSPGDAVPELVLPSTRPSVTRDVSPFSIDDILSRGKAFYDGKFINALRQAQEHAQADGILVTMPDLVQAKLVAKKSHKFWKDWYTTLSEEYVGMTPIGDEVVVTVHGGGIFSTSERIQRAYDDGLVNGAGKLVENEFEDLLEGLMPGGWRIPMYSYDEFTTETEMLPRRYGVITPLSQARAFESGYQKAGVFCDNPLAIVRCGGKEYAVKYHAKAKDGDGEVGCWHPFAGVDPSVAQGRLLYLINNHYGLYGGNNLDDNGRFVGVSAGGARSKKRGKKLVA